MLNLFCTIVYPQSVFFFQVAPGKLPTFRPPSSVTTSAAATAGFHPGAASASECLWARKHTGLSLQFKKVFLILRCEIIVEFCVFQSLYENPQPGTSSSSFMAATEEDLV